MKIKTKKLDRWMDKQDNLQSPPLSSLCLHQCFWSLMGHGQGQSIFKVRLTYVSVTEMILCKYEHNLPNDKIVELPKSTLEED